MLLYVKKGLMQQRCPSPPLDLLIFHGDCKDWLFKLYTVAVLRGELSSISSSLIHAYTVFRHIKCQKNFHGGKLLLQSNQQQSNSSNAQLISQYKLHVGSTHYDSELAPLNALP